MSINSAPALNQKQTRKVRSATFRTALLVSLGGLFLHSASAAFAQEATTLRNPLIQGAYSTPAGTTPLTGDAPPIGSGSTPLGVPQGMTGNPTLLPWVPNVPFNNIDLQDTQLNLPYDNSVATPPGVLGSMLAPSIPAPPSTPGTNPTTQPGNGILMTVGGYATDAAVVQVLPQGGLPNGSAPTTRRGGQGSGDYGLGRVKGSLNTDFGQPLLSVPNLAKTPQVAEDGPRNLTYDSNLIPTTTGYFTNPTAQQTPGSTDPTNGLLYGNRTLFKGQGVYTNATQANY